MQTAKLTERLRSGDKEALFSLMSSYYNDLFRYGIKFTADKDLTKDIIGQFFLHIWDHHGKFAAADNIRNYLIVSYKRFIIDYLRKITRQLNISERNDAEYEYSYEEYLIAFQNEEAVKHALKQAVEMLPARQRELIQLRYYEHLSYDEIAHKTSLSIRTVYNKLHEAIKTLKHPLLKESISRNFLVVGLLVHYL